MSNTNTKISDPASQTPPSSRNQRHILWYAVSVLALAGAFTAGWDYGFHETAEISPPAATKGKTHIQGSGALANSSKLTLPWNPKSALGEIMKKFGAGERYLAIARLVEASPVPELASLLAEVNGCPDRAARKIVFDLSYAKWVAADAPGALAYAMATSRMRVPENTPIPDIFIMWGRIDPKAALAAALKLDNATFREDAISKVLNNWVQGDDPLGAIAAIKNLPPGAAFKGEMRWAFQRWSELDPVAALANLDQIENAELRHTVQNIIISNLADSDPAQAVNLLRNLPPSQQTPQNYTDVFQAWARLDHDAAFAALKDIPAGAARVTAVTAVFNGWAEIDPAGALQAAQTFPAGPDRNKAVELSLTNLVLQNPSAAADYVAGLPMGAQRNDFILSLVNNWADADSTSALAWLNKNATGAVLDNSVAQVLAKMTASDPNGAFAYIMQMPEGQKRDDYLNQNIGTWAAQDPKGAMNWAQNNLSGNAQSLAISKVISQMTQLDPTAAAGYFAQLPDSPARNGVILSIASSLAVEDSQAALKWVQNLPSDVPDATKTSAMQKVINTLATIDPVSTAAYVQTLAADSNSSAAIASVATAWAASDSQAALNWAQSLPNGQVRDNATSAALTSMAANDSPGAWAYAQNLPPNDTTGKMLTGILNIWGRTDPGEAAAALTALPAETVPTTTFSVAAFYWAQKDPQGAAQWVQSLPPGAAQNAAASQLNTKLRSGPVLSVQVPGFGPILIDSAALNALNNPGNSAPSGRPARNNAPSPQN